jgi:asparagine synthase (glutamine-hydrolysing)
VTRQLVAIVDRLASRPIFYYQDPEHLILSSDIRAILGVPGVDCSVDLESLAQFVRIQTVLGNHTLYREIRTLLPGTVLRASSQKSDIQIHRYWSMEPLSPFEDEEDAIRGVQAAFLKAGQRIAKGTKRGGILLSGGLDSRLVLAILKSNAKALEAFTFGSEFTDEIRVAEAVARSAHVPWRFIGQTGLDYWAQLDALLPTLQAQYSIFHTHPIPAAKMMAQVGIDTIYHGIGLCGPFSGSQLPKEYWTFAGRKVWTSRLAPLSTQADVRRIFLRNHDIQGSEFGRSFLMGSMRDAWHAGTEQALDQAFADAAEKWTSPYDLYQKGMVGAGYFRLRTYIVATCNRAFARERSPGTDADVLDAYRRLTVRQRFLGPIYRRAFERIDPVLAQIVYPNTGTSPFAPPLVQALALQARQLGRANRERLRRLLAGLGLGRVLQQKTYGGGYISPPQLVQVLALGDLPAAVATRSALTDGFLAQSGIVDAGRLRQRLDEGGFTDRNEALTVLALASLAAWFDKYPAEAGHGA